MCIKWNESSFSYGRCNWIKKMKLTLTLSHVTEKYEHQDVQEILKKPPNAPRYSSVVKSPMPEESSVIAF